MFLETLVALSLSQNVEVRKPVVVTASSKRPGTDAVAAQIVSRIRETLIREGVGDVLTEDAGLATLKSAGVKDSKTCQGSSACLNKLAILVGPKAVVVGIDVGKVGKTLAVHIESTAADSEKALASLDVSASADDWNETLAVAFVTFVRQVKSALMVKSAPRIDVPVETVMVPKVKTADPAIVAVQAAVEQKPFRVAPWLAVGGAVLAAAGTATFSVLASSDAQTFKNSLVQLPDGSLGSQLSRPDAEALSAAANTKAGVAIGSGIATAGLGALAVYLFSQSE
jgi:hypothetical protein